MGVHCCCLHVNYIVYKHFDKSLHVGLSDPKLYAACALNQQCTQALKCECGSLGHFAQNGSPAQSNLWTCMSCSLLSGWFAAEFKVVERVV